MKKCIGKFINIEYRMYPDKYQANYISGMLEACRIVYNELVIAGLKIMDKNKGLSKEERGVFKLPNWGYIKEMYPWLNNYPTAPFDYERLNVNAAFSNYFDILSGKKKPRKTYKEFVDKATGEKSIKGVVKKDYGKPAVKKRFKKRNLRLKFRDVHLIDDCHIKIPRLKKPIRFVPHSPFPGSFIRIVSVTLKKKPSNDFYIVFTIEVEDFPKLTGVDYGSNKVIALDLGINKYFTYEYLDGELGRVENPRNYKRFQDRINFYNFKMSRQVQFSNRYHDTRIKKNNKEEQLANCRKYFLNNLSTRLIRECDTIIAEKLDVQDIVQETNKTFKNESKQARSNINKSTYDVGWYMFTQMLKYKSEWNGRNFYLIDTKNKTVQTCSNCGYVESSLKDVSIREWTCPNCDTHHDRCENACHNILKLYKEGKVLNYIKKDDEEDEDIEIVEE